MTPDDLARLVASREWRQAFHETPRECFIPDAAWADPLGSEHGYWIDRGADPNTWCAAVYSDTTILTQVDDGASVLSAESATGGTPSSSSTAPSIVAAFLDLLAPHPGNRVLEIGTGTGWTAALLSARLGAESITTVEVDGQVAEQAAANLKRSGHHPHLVVGDGAKGWPDNAPYDGVHVTCGVQEIPFAWVEQVHHGGVIVAPWAPNRISGHMLKLTVQDGVATGRLHGGTAFMMLRAQRFPDPPPRSEHRQSTARVGPWQLSEVGRGFEVALAGLLPGVFLNGFDADSGGLRDSTGNYAFAVRSPDEGHAEVTQIGARDLWTELEDAYFAWVSMGEPGADRIGVTVDATGQHIWVDTPNNRVTKG